MRSFITAFLIICFLAVLPLSGNSKAEGTTTIVFGDVSWDSVQVHNRIAAFIIENGFEGYEVEYTPGDTLPIVNAVAQGDVHVDMESWHSNFPEVYEKETSAGNIIDLGENMPDAPQGWYIPRYVIEGPDAVAPGLESIDDLADYAELFPDPEDPGMGVVYGGVAGWSQMAVSEEIFAEAGLGETFNLQIAGSNAALAGSMAGAFEKGEPWIGYYWEPTAILGKLDMVRLPGTEYDRAYVNILVNKDLPEMAPEVVEMLKKYNTTVADNNEFLAKMDAEDWDAQQAAEWFLKNKESVWTEWVPSDVAEKVKAAL